MSSPSKEVRKAYYHRNREKILQKQKETYLQNKEKLLEYQRQYRTDNREHVTVKARNKRKTRLLWAIDFLGGKCSKCGGVFDPCVYDFHHTQPEHKDFTIGENMLVGKQRFEQEVKKCILLCANCHRLEHKKESD